MTDEQQRQIEACRNRVKFLRWSGLVDEWVRVELRREGWPEAAIMEAMCDD